MKYALQAIFAGIMGLGIVGCIDNSPPPPRVPVPAPGYSAPITRRDDAYKPLPADAPPVDQLPFNDVPIISQQPPEMPAFVDAYRKVGSPRIVVFVNRSLDPNPGQDISGYLRPGEYDEANAREIDYEAMETILTDWISCGGQVTIVSPLMARQRLTEEQYRQLQEGRPQVQSQIVEQLGADIFINMRIRPTKQTVQGLELRLLGEALNVRGGESLARAVVDVPPPLTKPVINDYTRFVARKIMDGMLGSWSAPPPTDRPTTRPMGP